MISICVPTYNSLPYLKILYASLKKNWRVPYELLVHSNACTDGTYKWLVENNIKYTHSINNQGFCGVNNVLEQAKYEYCFVVNSDMYILPGCDFTLVNQIKEFKKDNIDKFTISCRLVEPIPGNPEYVYFNAGYVAEQFREQELVDWYVKNRPQYPHATKQWSHPILFPKKLGKEAGFFDPQYWPGWGVDNDFPKELSEKGCKNFFLTQQCQVYHFVSKTFKQLTKEDNAKSGEDIFTKKWGLTQNQFRDSMQIKKPFEVVK
jgi:glycosyltransferase involved in cell wall biosynthesis